MMEEDIFFSGTEGGAEKGGEGNNCDTVALLGHERK